MTVRPTVRALALVSFLVSAWFAPAAMAADLCAPIKTQVECGKKPACKWSGKACSAVAKAAAKPAAKAGEKGAKTAPKAGAKPAKAAAAKPAKKPAEVKAAPPAPAPVPTEPPMEDDMAPTDGDAEDF